MKQIVFRVLTHTLTPGNARTQAHVDRSLQDHEPAQIAE
jgi:hypothetical protein